jgi:hypothetical protein
MWPDPSPAGATAEPEPLPVRFVLSGEGPHALSPGLAIGPALCGEEEPDPGWALAGFTSTDLDRIGCDDCRRIAGRMVDAAREPSVLAAGLLFDPDNL